MIRPLMRFAKPPCYSIYFCLNIHFNPNPPGVSNGIMSPVSQPKLPPPVPPAPVPKPRPAPRPLQKKPSSPPSPPSEAVYDQPLHLPPPRKGRGRATPNKPPPNDYDDLDALQAQSSGPMKPTGAGLYDDVSDVLGE